jgi:hypothetical protein
MSALAEANYLVRLIGAGAVSKKDRRLRAWRKVAPHFSWNRIVDIDRGAQHVRVRGDELEILRAAARQQEEGEREAQRKYQEIIDRIARLEARLLEIDPDFYRAEMSALRSVLGGAGDDDSAVDQG